MHFKFHANSLLYWPLTKHALGIVVHALHDTHSQYIHPRPLMAHHRAFLGTWLMAFSRSMFRQNRTVGWWQRCTSPAAGEQWYLYQAQRRTAVDESSQWMRVVNFAINLCKLGFWNEFLASWSNRSMNYWDTNTSMVWIIPSKFCNHHHGNYQNIQWIDDMTSLPVGLVEIIKRKDFTHIKTNTTRNKVYLMFISRQDM